MGRKIHEDTALAKAIVASGKTQKEIAQMVGIQQSQMTYYTHGAKTPGVSTAIRIADALGVVDIRELFS